MEEEKEMNIIRIREFDMERDTSGVEELERRCQVGLSGDQGTDVATTGSRDNTNNKCKNSDTNKKDKNTNKGMSLYVEQIGDPLARVRHAPDHLMLVAEYGEEEEMVGVIKACIKMVSRGTVSATTRPAYIKVAYLLGLRVSPSHRRLGVATRLVQHAESWCIAHGAAYICMATTVSNTASLSLFTRGFSYAPFRRPVLLGHPIHAHQMPVPHSHRILHLRPPIAAALYARLLPPSSAEFLPSDLPSLLAHKLTLGTFLALPRTPNPSRPSSFALLSVWDSTRSLRLRVGGASTLVRASLAALRALDKHAPWMQLPSIPDIFRPFGPYLLYGLHMAGPDGPRLLRSLCHFTHNLARKNPMCAVLAAEVGPDDPTITAIPHWRKFSCDEDIWCIKRVVNDALEGNADADGADWTTPPTGILFVDPREF